MHTPPRFILIVTLLCSVVVMLTAIGGAIGGLRGQDFYFAGFEAVLAVCGFIGIFIGLGRFNDGPSVAIASVGGATAMCSVLGYMTIGGEIFVSGSIFGAHGHVMGVDVFLPFLGRLGIGGLLGALAGVVLLSRDPSRSMPLLVKGVVFGMPVVVVLGLWFGVSGVRATFGGLHMMVQVFIGALATVVGIGLISASGHCLIRAFEIGVEVAKERERAQETPERTA